MRKGDGPLVFFTVLSQWSVGIVLCLAVLAGSGSFVLETGLRLQKPVLFALFLLVAATTLSLLHLGNPVNAPKALRNLGTSWLSREILGIGLYSLCLIAVLVSGWIPGGAAYRGYLLAICSIAGLFLVWAMARVYRIPTIPAWDSGFTLLGFLTTSLSLGLIACLLLDALDVINLAIDARTRLKGLLLAVLALEMGVGIVNRIRLARMDTGIDGPSFDSGVYRRLFDARMVVLLLTCAVLLTLVLRPELSSGNAVLFWLYPTLALVVVQETLGRIEFYSSYFRVGV